MRWLKHGSFALVAVLLAAGIIGVSEEGDTSIARLKAAGRSPDSELTVSKQIGRYLEKNGSDFQADAYAPNFQSIRDCPSDFNRIEDPYLLKGEVNSLFQAFVSRSPLDAWHAPVAFDLLVEPTDGPGGTVVYDRGAASFPPYAVGQLYFLTLRAIPGVKLPVALRIVEMDPKAHRVGLSYVKSGVAQGIQDIEFRQEGDSVRILHTTCFKSGSKLRDRIYPLIHGKFVSRFYETFAKSVATELR